MQRNGGYTFIKANVTKLLLSITIILLSFYFFDTYILDIDSAAAWATGLLSPFGLISLFSQKSALDLLPRTSYCMADETLKPK